MTDDQQRARELLKAECERIGANSAVALEQAAIAAITAALRAAPDGFVLVPVAEVESALDVVRDAMECAYHNRFPECCGQYSPSGCCGNPREAWSKEDQSIMDALHPAEQALAEMLAARPQGVKDRQPTDGCTESNCKRCRTHPNHRGDMEHAGIGWRPDSPQEASDA